MCEDTYTHNNIIMAITLKVITPNYSKIHYSKQSNFSPVPLQHTSRPGLRESLSLQCGNSCRPSHNAEPGSTSRPSS